MSRTTHTGRRIASWGGATTVRSSGATRTASVMARIGRGLGVAINVAFLVGTVAGWGALMFVTMAPGYTTGLRDGVKDSAYLVRSVADIAKAGYEVIVRPHADISMDDYRISTNRRSHDPEMQAALLTAERSHFFREDFCTYLVARVVRDVLRKAGSEAPFVLVSAPVELLCSGADALVVVGEVAGKPVQVAGTRALSDGSVEVTALYGSSTARGWLSAYRKGS